MTTRPGPATPAGKAALSILRDEAPEISRQMAARRPHSGELVGGALFLLARRRFRTGPDPAAIRDFVERFLRADDAYKPRRARTCEQVIAAQAAYRRPARMPLRQQWEGIRTAVALAAAAAPEELPEVVYAAELTWWRQQPDPVSYAALDEVQRPPSTRDGRILEAYMLQDYRLAGTLYSEPEPGPSCLGRAYELTVERCLPGEVDPAVRDEAAVRSARRCPSPPLDAEAIGRLLRGGVPVGPDQDPHGALSSEAKMFTMAELAQIAGLLPTEIRALIRAAEQATAPADPAI